MPLKLEPEFFRFRFKLLKILNLLEPAQVAGLSAQVAGLSAQVAGLLVDLDCFWIPKVHFVVLLVVHDIVLDRDAKLR